MPNLPIQVLIDAHISENNSAMTHLDVRPLQSFVRLIRRAIVLMFSTAQTSGVSAGGLGLSGKGWGQLTGFQKMMTLKADKTAKIADWHPV